MQLREGGERRTKHREVQCRHFLVEQFRQDVSLGLANRGFIPIPQLIKLRQHLVLQGTQHQIRTERYDHTVRDGEDEIPKVMGVDDTRPVVK